MIAFLLQSASQNDHYVAPSVFGGLVQRAGSHHTKRPIPMTEPSNQCQRGALSYKFLISSFKLFFKVYKTQIRLRSQTSIISMLNWCSRYDFHRVYRSLNPSRLCAISVWRILMILSQAMTSLCFLSTCACNDTFSIERFWYSSSSLFCQELSFNILFCRRRHRCSSIAFSSSRCNVWSCALKAEGSTAQVATSAFSETLL